jgi:hypothetical protein
LDNLNLAFANVAAPIDGFGALATQVLGLKHHLIHKNHRASIPYVEPIFSLHLRGRYLLYFEAQGAEAIGQTINF